MLGVKLLIFQDAFVVSVQTLMSVSWGYMTATSSALTLRVPSSVAALKDFKLIQMGPAQVRN